MSIIIPSGEAGMSDGYNMGLPGNSPEDQTSAKLDIITAAARSWLYELEAEIIPGAGSQEDRDGYEEQAVRLREALTSIGVEV